MLLWQYRRVMRGDTSLEFLSSSTEENPRGQREVANEIRGLSPPALGDPVGQAVSEILGRVGSLSSLGGQHPYR